jgi:tetratricopeptide (TPR) repeat protein
LIFRRIQVAEPENEWETYLFTQTERYLGGTLAEMGRPQEGEKLIREALAEIEPIAQRRSQYALMVVHLATLDDDLGNCLLAEGRLSEAHDAYIQSRDAHRRLYEAHTDAPSHTLGILYALALCPDESVRDPAAAVSIARAALQRMPRVQRLYLDFGAALYQTGDWPGAIHALETAQQIGPNDLGFFRYILALAQFKSGQPELARASLAQAEHWDNATRPRYHEPQSFAAEARQVILGNAVPPAASTAPTTMPAESGSHP